MLIGAKNQPGIYAQCALVTREDVGADLLHGVAHVRLAVDVVDRGSEVVLLSHPVAGEMTSVTSPRTRSPILASSSVAVPRSSSSWTFVSSRAISSCRSGE